MFRNNNPICYLTCVYIILRPLRRRDDQTKNRPEAYFSKIGNPFTVVTLWVMKCCRLSCRKTLDGKKRKTKNTRKNEKKTEKRRSRVGVCTA